MAFHHHYIFCFHEYQKIREKGDKPFENNLGKLFLRNRLSGKNFKENSLIHFN